MKKEEKIIELLEMIVKQNEEIIKNQNIWRTFPAVPVPPNIDPHFGKDIPYVPYNDGTKTSLPLKTLPDREWYG